MSVMMVTTKWYEDNEKRIEELEADAKRHDDAMIAIAQGAQQERIKELTAELKQESKAAGHWMTEANKEYNQNTRLREALQEISKTCNRCGSEFGIARKALQEEK